MPPDPLAWVDDRLQDLRRRGRYRHLRARGTPQSPTAAKFDGVDVINFASNDYLGLAADGRLRSVERAVHEYGWGSGASPLLGGRSEEHAALERELAEFETAEAALLFPTGYAANLGAVTSLVGAGDVVFSDRKNHASIIDACRLSRADVRIYPHGDVDALRSLMKEHEAARKLIVTDGLFSMDGDLAPLPALAELAERNNAMLMVDEAHATGVIGAMGRGACELLGVEDGVHLRVGSFSKALGSHGGFAVASHRLIQWLSNAARPYFFSTAAPAALAAAARSALRIVRDEPQRRKSVLSKAEGFRQRLTDLDLNFGHSQSQIVPVYVGDADRVMEISRELWGAGLFAPGIRPPSVPEGESLIRVGVCHGHGDKELDRLVSALAEAAI